MNEVADEMYNIVCSKLASYPIVRRDIQNLHDTRNESVGIHW